MKFVLFLLLFIECINCQAQEFDYSKYIEERTVYDIPPIDGSDSTEPLRDILMCKLLGFDYKWERAFFLPEEGQDPYGIKVNYNCSSDDIRYLVLYKMLNSNTHGSFINLIDGHVKLILTARSISRDEKAYADEKGCTLIEKPIAKDAFTFMVNNSNPVNSLTIEQIQGIYTGDIVNWSEVGGPDMPITAYIRNRNSGSQEKFETMVMKGLTIKKTPEFQIGHVMEAPYEQLEHDKSGIAFTPFYYYDVIVDNGSTKAIGVNGIDMSRENIMNGSYPYITDVYAAVRSDIDKSSAAYKIFEMLTEPEGQAIVAESKYIPLGAYVNLESVNAECVNINFNDQILSIDSDLKPELIKIVDTKGCALFTSKVNANRMNIPKLDKGVYILYVKFDNGVETAKKIACK